jgi:hypothetical protein
MRFSKSTSKLKVGAEMAAGQVGGTSVFICDVPGTCGVHQGTRMAITAFSVQELKFGKHTNAHSETTTIGSEIERIYGESLLSDDTDILKRPPKQRKQ